MTRINYQIMTKKQGGNYIPDYDELIANATCEEEADYIRSVRDKQELYATRGIKPGFLWNMVYIIRQNGRFGIFQMPCNEHHTLEDNLRLAEEDSKKSF